MSTPESLRALRRANPRTRPDFARSVEAAAEAIDARVGAASRHGVRRSWRPRRVVGVSLGGASLGLAVAAVLVTLGSPGGHGVENARAAVSRAATLTAASAERSGTAVVRMTHGGAPWTARTIRWNGDDLALSQDGRSRAGSGMLVVDGMMYGVDERDGGWVEMGPPESVDPDSGTTPAEYLAAVREDVGGPTLSRIADGITGLSTRGLDDGSTVYTGKVAAGLIARESAVTGGESIRVLPFGYVAHDEAADPGAPLDVAVTVAEDGVVRKIAVTWGTWSYTVAYSALGETPAPVAPADARPLRRSVP